MLAHCALPLTADGIYVGPEREYLSSDLNGLHTTRCAADGCEEHGTFTEITGVELNRKYVTEVVGVPPSPSPISNAVVVGNQCWISGQLSVGDDGKYAPGTTREEAERAFAHVFRIAEAAGFDRSEIVYVDLAFIDLADVAEANELYAELFPPGRRPARTIYQAAKLPFGGRIKVQAIAAR